MKINWNKSNGLIPAIIQDAKTQQVVMLGYMNEESLRLTQETGLVTFFSRTRQTIWQKGETSGHTLEVVNIAPDCDQDALLIQVQPKGPVCHRNTKSCFDAVETDPAYAFLTELENTLKDRITVPSDQSYVSALVQSGIDRVIQKVGEEAIETVIAAKNKDLAALEGEAADLVFHLMVLLQTQGTQLKNIVTVLKKRAHSKEAV